MEQDEQKDKNGEKRESMTEESFLKDIYYFMKKRETPIDRIPHLGFKQINLYMMYKAVMELGGYHQVTAQQLWKKVYNILGGNPRSTSAATCTRRHYEKLLLPYEYHSAGYRDEIPITLPRQRKRFHPEDEYNQGSKRADYTHLHPFNQYLPPGPISLPSYLSMSLPSIPPLSSPLPSHPMMSAESGNVKQSLDFLRHLAQEYKSSSGWTEPLNLSKKQGRLDTSSNMPSSFTSPSAKKKEPKFLNEAPRIQQSNQAGVCDVPAPEQASITQTLRDESHGMNLISSCSSSKSMWKVTPCSTPPHPPPPPPPPPPPQLPPHRPNYPGTVQTKHTPQQSIQAPVPKSRSSSTSQLSPGPINSTFPFDPYAGMEIQIPFSLFQNLIKDGLILNTASNQDQPTRSKTNEQPSFPERTNDDQPADLSLKTQVRDVNKSDISMNALKIANERQESKQFAMKPLQAPEPSKFPLYNISQLKSPQRVFQEQQKCTKPVPSTSVRLPDQPGFRSPGYSKDASQIGYINPGMTSEKSVDSSTLVKVKSSSSSFIHMTPEHLKLFFSRSPFRLESGKIC